MSRLFIRLSRPSVNGTRVSISVSCSQALKAYVRDPTFWYESDSLGDVRALPESLLVIPAVGNMITLAWATGADLHVDELDKTYIESLKRVQRTMTDLHPALRIRKSRLRVGTPVSNSKPDGEARTGLLFSGGIDSLTSLLDHRDVVTDLFSIWGIDFGTDNHRLWELGVLPILTKVAATSGARGHVIRSNVREFLSYWVNIDFGKYLTTGTWWGGLQHGVGLLSLIAPVAYAHDVNHVLIASSHSVDYDPPWGSMPCIDNDVAWAGASVTHDGFEFSRQQKIADVIAPFARKQGQVTIACCWRADRSDKLLNCGTCEKCIRTQAGLLAAGVDPAQMGFCPPIGVFMEAGKRFRDRKYRLDGAKLFMWLDIQSQLRRNPDVAIDKYGIGTFFAWLRETRLEELEDVPPQTVTLISPVHPFDFMNRIGRRLPLPAQRVLKDTLKWKPIREVLMRI